jgi:3-hydroxyacyl-CoA dehydrogenase
VEALKDVAVVGAAGKMGAGITLLLLQAMAKQELIETGRIGWGKYRLVAVDPSRENLFRLRSYVRQEMQKWAEKQIIFLRRGYREEKELVSNEEIIRAACDGSYDIVSFATAIEETKGIKLFFEAISEDVNLKIAVLKRMRKEAFEGAICYSNTSSIPIHLLAKESGWNENFAGFHFYNPPLLQPIVELVLSSSDQVNALAKELVAAFGKSFVLSGDVAGFIGNGYLMREIAFSCQLVKSLKLPSHEAICLINSITQRLLLRPMGIFQLADYVGLDICNNIAHVMAKQLGEPELIQPLIQRMVEKNLLAGHAAGKQKNGFFAYKGMHPVGVYVEGKGDYEPFSEEELAKKFSPVLYKAVVEKSQSFCDIENEDLSAALVQGYMQNLVAIENRLIDSQVISNGEPLHLVLREGFGHKDVRVREKAEL